MASITSFPRTCVPGHKHIIKNCKNSMPSRKGQDKRDSHKKSPKKDFSSPPWQDRLADNREENDGDMTDPELIAEKEYALEHGTEFDVNSIDRRSFSMIAGGDAQSKPDKAKKDGMISAKIKQAKADRKARGRGVSGSMCKKDKGIAYGGFHTLMDMDVYYGLDDEYGTYTLGTEEPFVDQEDGYESDFCQEKESLNQSKIDLINEDMNEMFLKDDDEEEDDDRPGPSRSHRGTGDG
ncbi:unnamed protein product [Litomosoides sigmodontis]|uniref:Uncharacterized protein n=1 Tax=Litomosoides sigmodontis TaxID=42156 RepID=A0A3P6TSW0_LITSI|nr:unnamed protein product [Litomosoides sigmodontis]